MMISETGKQAFSLIELIVTMTIVIAAVGIMLKAAVQLIYIDKKIHEKRTLLSLGDQLWFSLMDGQRWPVPEGLTFNIGEKELPPGEDDYYRQVNIVLYREGENAKVHYTSGYIRFP